MINFEDIIDFLALKGVKSLHIEMQSGERITTQNEEKIGNLSRTETVTVERPPVCACAAKHDQVVHRGEPGAGEPVIVPTTEAPRQLGVPPSIMKEPCSETRCAQDHAEFSARLATTQDRVVEKVIKPAIASVMPLVVVDELNIPAKADPKPAKKAVTDTVAKTAGKPPYELFCDMISADDGKVTAEERVTLINLMGLDDLLRVNNDFQLGLDTDKPVDDVRADVIECFK